MLKGGSRSLALTGTPAVRGTHTAHVIPKREGFRAWCRSVTAEPVQTMMRGICY
jgi:hypothetical protein